MTKCKASERFISFVAVFFGIVVLVIPARAAIRGACVPAEKLGADDEIDYEESDSGDEEDTEYYGPDKHDIYEFGLAVWMISGLDINANVITSDVDDLGEKGSDVNYADDFGLKDSATSFYLRGDYAYNKGKNIAAISLSQIAASGSGIIPGPDPIIHGDYRYPVGADMSIDITMLRIGLHHLWQIKQNKKKTMKLYIGLSIQYIDWTSVLDTDVVVEEAEPGGWVNVGGAEATQKYPVPLPTFDTRLRWKSHKHPIIVEMDLSLLPTGVFNWADFQLNAGYDIAERVKVFAGAHVLYATGDAKMFVDYPLNGDLIAPGAQVGLEVHFGQKQSYY